MSVNPDREPPSTSLRALHAAAWSAAAPALRAAVGGPAFEIRYALDGQAAIRQPVGEAGPGRHVEPAPAPGIATAEAACGAARAWLLAAGPPADAGAAQAALELGVARCSALTLQRLRAQRDAIAAVLTERSVHRTRADLSALGAAWDAATQHELTEAELGEFRVAIRETARAAQARLDAEAMMQRAFGRGHPPRAIDVRRAWEDAAAALPADGVPQPAPAADPAHVWMPAPLADWGLRRLATVAREDPRLAGRDPVLAIEPHPVGWELSLGAPAADATVPEPWPGPSLGEADRVGALAVSYGGEMSVTSDGRGGLRLHVALPGAQP